MVESADPDRASLRQVGPGRRNATSPRGRARLVVGGAVAVTALLYVVPYGHYIGYPLILLSTFAHEMGHGIAAILVGGEFDSFRMFSDASGVATVRGNFGRVSRAFFAAGGLVGPPILAGIFFLLASRQRLARAGLFLFGAAMLFSCVWVVRGWFGWLFVGVVGAVTLVIAYRASAAVSQGVIAFLACQLTLSVFSRGDYLFTDTAVTGNGQSTSPSDVANMAEALFLPYWFWGAVCGLFSVLVLVGGLWLFWRVTRAETPGLSTAVD